MVTGDSDEHLGSLRDELDRIDATLLDTVRARIDVCVQIAVVKHEHEIPMMQPQRVGIVRDRARTFAEQHQMSADFLDSLYQQLIAEACRVEDLVIESKSAARTTETEGSR